MIRNKVSIERQLDERLYQFLIPSEGNWNEVLIFSKEIACYAENQIEAAKKTAPVIDQIVEPEVVEEPKG